MSSTVAQGSSASCGRANVLLLGGTSEIGLAVVRRLAQQQALRPFLAGRDRERLNVALAELAREGCRDGQICVLDAQDVETHERLLDGLFENAGRFEVVVLAIGVLGAQAGLDADPREALRVMRVNFLGCGSLILHTLRNLRRQHAGTLIVLSSVAAERPRASNAVYGAAKAGLDALAQGLADATAESGVRVLIVRPGFVRTRMTAGLEPAPFASSPQAVADAVAGALAGHVQTVWVPGVLRPLFAVLRHLPRPVYRKLPL